MFTHRVDPTSSVVPWKTLYLHTEQYTFTAKHRYTAVYTVDEYASALAEATAEREIGEFARSSTQARATAVSSRVLGGSPRPVSLSVLARDEEWPRFAVTYAKEYMAFDALAEIPVWDDQLHAEHCAHPDRYDRRDVIEATTLALIEHHVRSGDRKKAIFLLHHRRTEIAGTPTASPTEVQILARRHEAMRLALADTHKGIHLGVRPRDRQDACAAYRR